MLRERALKERFEILKSMNTLIKAMNNEEAYLEWIYLIPDQADDDELMECAEDSEIFKEACELFRALLKRYGKDGFYLCLERAVC